MTEIDNDKLLKDFFAENKREIADNGFSRRVMHHLPDRSNRLARLWTVFVMTVGATLFVTLGGLEAVWETLKDVLIGQGYTPDDFSKVPEETMKLAKVKSGYEQSKSQYELTKRETEHATLVAPFDGIVANLFSKPYNLANTSEAFCTVIDTRGMETDFTVLENELAFIKTGDKVMITPYAGGGSYEGSVSEINPLVDANGMVKVKAAVNGQGKLFSGMNVRVSVKRSLGEQLVIPKTAVVLRSGKQVVFTLKEGKAMWNYVHTGLENATEYVVSDKSQGGVEDGLLEGDTVIVTGNLNLAHETEVTISGE